MCAIWLGSKCSEESAGAAHFLKHSVPTVQIGNLLNNNRKVLLFDVKPECNPYDGHMAGTIFSMGIQCYSPIHTCINSHGPNWDFGLLKCSNANFWSFILWIIHKYSVYLAPEVFPEPNETTYLPHRSILTVQTRVVLTIFNNFLIWTVRIALCTK